MDINHLQQELGLKNLQTLMKIFSENDQTGLNRNIKDNQINNKYQDLISLLEKLSPEARKTLLNTWLKMNLSLSEELLTNLVKISNSLSNNSELNIKNLITAAAFMQKNSLPLSSGLLKGIASNFSSNPNLSSLLIQSDTNNSARLPAEYKQLLLDISKDTAQITDTLKSYPEKMGNLLETLLQNSAGEDKSTLEIINHLQGQFLLQQVENPLLLTMDLPLYWPEQEKITPLQFRIWKGNKQKEKNSGQNPKNVYTLSFNLELEKRGVIQAAIIIKKSTVKSIFLTSNEKTAQLIKQNFNLLQNKLKDLEYKPLPPLVKVKEDLSTKNNKIFEQKNDEENMNIEKNKYTPIDFFV